MLNTIIANQSLGESLVIRTLKGANNRRLKVVNPIVGTGRPQENHNQLKQANSLRLEKIAKSDSKTETTNPVRSATSPSSRANTRQRFTLSAEQSDRLSQIRNNGSQKKNPANAHPFNASINQYLETQNFQRREEIETLVGFDLFV